MISRCRIGLSNIVVAVILTITVAVAGSIVASEISNLISELSDQTPISVSSYSIEVKSITSSVLELSVHAEFSGGSFRDLVTPLIIAISQDTGNAIVVECQTSNVYIPEDSSVFTFTCIVNLPEIQPFYSSTSTGDLVKRFLSSVKRVVFVSDSYGVV